MDFEIINFFFLISFSKNPFCLISVPKKKQTEAEMSNRMHPFHSLWSVN